MVSAVQRKNMVDSQVRPSDVTDRRIARAMLDIPREAFVPPAKRAIAYMDGDLVLSGEGHGSVRALLAPRTLSKMIQYLALSPDAAVLDVAPATGYSTAVLAHIATRVVAVESDAALAEEATAALAALSIRNAEVHVGALGDGFATRGPYDAILLGGKVAEVPQALLNQLKDGGRLVAIIDVNGVGKVYGWIRFAANFDCQALFDADAHLLPGFERAAEFVF
ncbi:MAG: protein-L-isoaspartate O-methyltransferase [Hyphomicrobiaceae bacterium]